MNAESNILSRINEFKRRPNGLIHYIETGIHGNYLVLGPFIAQLANMTGIPLKRNDTEHTTLRIKFYNPKGFDNIEDILKVAKETLRYRGRP